MDTASMKQALASGLPQLERKLTDAQLDTFCAFGSALVEKNQVMNLTAIEGEEATARLHFLDSAALLRYVRLSGKTAADIGSGAGFPGLVAAILAPDADITLIDSLQKRVTFQQEVCDTVGLGNVTCLAGRAEEESALRESFEVVTSRAVARMTMLCELCLPLVRVGGVFAAMKGPEPEEEVQEAARCIRTLGGGKPRIEKYTVPGTDAVHSVVIIPKTAPTPAKYPRRFAMIKKQPL